MNFSQNLPNRERLSLVVSTIMLAYAISQAVNFPGQEVPLAIGGFLIPFEFDIPTIITVAVAGVTATGTDWIMRDHPALKDKLTLPHLLLPTLTAWILSISLNNLADVPFKWLVLIVGGVFLLVVILAEYLVLNPDDYRAPVGVALLTAIAYAMIVALSVSLESTDQRLIVALPAIALGSGILSMRILQLQSDKAWPVLESTATLLVVVQFGSVLHYLPLTPLAYGILMLGVMFSMVNFIINQANQTNLTRGLIEAAVTFMLTILMALWLN